MPRSTLGDSVPLVLRGYRFYTSFNKGFAPVFVWHPHAGRPVGGSVHLPAYPLHEYRQAREWTPPGSTLPVWTMLQIDEPLLEGIGHERFRVPERHRIVLRIGDVRHELRPGDSVPLPGGTLQYQRLSTWMGYTVFHDWTKPWLLAACAVAVARPLTRST